MWKTEFSVSERSSVLERIKRSVGEDIYENYVKLRRVMLGAEIKVTTSGPRIEYVVIQRGQRPRVVFLHGFADCKENFFDSAHMLVTDYNLLIPDLPGFGKSFKKKKGRYNLQNYSDWLVDAIRAEGWTQFHLMGNSLGGAIALDIAIRYPDMVQTLTVLDPAGIVVTEVPSIYHEFLNGRSVFEIHSPMQFEYFLHRVFHKPPIIPPLVREHLFREFSRLSRWNGKILSDLLEGLTSMNDPRLEEVSLNHRLKDVKAPTLILWGDRDSFFPPVTGHLLRKEIKNSQLKFLKGLGHSPQNESPILVMKIVKEFLKGL
ncbi:MAG: alpha/beta hydrolase [Proteobacteria bacterium]|nr:MAG: alpha/beta hydrolase [Pseudomonadota bacterium]